MYFQWFSWFFICFALFLHWNCKVEAICDQWRASSHHQKVCLTCLDAPQSKAGASFQMQAALRALLVLHTVYYYVIKYRYIYMYIYMYAVIIVYYYY